eukprot:Pgem_evm1s7187
MSKSKEKPGPGPYTIYLKTKNPPLSIKNFQRDNQASLWLTQEEGQFYKQSNRYLPEYMMRNPENLSVIEFLKKKNITIPKNIEKDITDAKSLYKTSTEKLGLKINERKLSHQIYAVSQLYANIHENNGNCMNAIYAPTGSVRHTEKHSTTRKSIAFSTCNLNLTESVIKEFGNYFKAFVSKYDYDNDLSNLYKDNMVRIWNNSSSNNLKCGNPKSKCSSSAACFGPVSSTFYCKRCKPVTTEDCITFKSLWKNDDSKDEASKIILEQFKSPGLHIIFGCHDSINKIMMEECKNDVLIIDEFHTIQDYLNKFRFWTKASFDTLIGLTGGINNNLEGGMKDIKVFNYMAEISKDEIIQTGHKLDLSADKRKDYLNKTINDVADSIKKHAAGEAESEEKNDGLEKKSDEAARAVHLTWLNGFRKKFGKMESKEEENLYFYYFLLMQSALLRYVDSSFEFSKNIVNSMVYCGNLTACFNVGLDLHRFKEKLSRNKEMCSYFAEIVLSRNEVLQFLKKEETTNLIIQYLSKIEIRELVEKNSYKTYNVENTYGRSTNISVDNYNIPFEKLISNPVDYKNVLEESICSKDNMVDSDPYELLMDFKNGIELNDLVRKEPLDFVINIIISPAKGKTGTDIYYCDVILRTIPRGRDINNMSGIQSIIQMRGRAYRIEPNVHHPSIMFIMDYNDFCRGRIKSNDLNIRVKSIKSVDKIFKMIEKNFDDNPKLKILYDNANTQYVNGRAKIESWNKTLKENKQTYDKNKELLRLKTTTDEQKQKIEVEMCKIENEVKIIRKNCNEEVKTLKVVSRNILLTLKKFIDIENEIVSEKLANENRLIYANNVKVFLTPEEQSRMYKDYAILLPDLTSMANEEDSDEGSSENLYSRDWERDYSDSDDMSDFIDETVRMDENSEPDINANNILGEGIKRGKGQKTKIDYGIDGDDGEEQGDANFTNTSDSDSGSDKETHPKKK